LFTETEILQAVSYLSIGHNILSLFCLLTSFYMTVACLYSVNKLSAYIDAVVKPSANFGGRINFLRKLENKTKPVPH